MKKLSKVLALVMAACMCFAMAACGSSDSSASAPASDEASAAASADVSEAPAESSEALAADVQAIVDRGVLKVGVKDDVPGFGQKDAATGEFSGIEIDLAKKIGESLGVNVEFTPVTAATRGQLLDNGDIDLVMATFTITEERKQTSNFSTAYYTDAVTVMVKKDSGISSLADLAGKKVGVSQGSTSMAALQEAAGEDVSIDFQEFATYPEIKAALDSGRVDAFSVDGSILGGYLDDTVELLSERFSPQEYGVTSKKDNTGLAEYVENLIQGWLADGTIDQVIADNNVTASYKADDATATDDAAATEDAASTASAAA